jgi:hypothetical protein
MTTIEERYSRAVRSSHLQVTTKEPGDVDKLIAAGWVKDSLGTTLYRLRTEFDAIAADLRRASDPRGTPDPGAVLTERMLILMRLKSLERARDHLGNFAQQLATRGRHMLDNAAVATIAGRVLDVFLDPNCHHCAGRGFNGGSHRGEARVLCRHCKGSGHRKGWIGRDAKEQEFAAHLLAAMDRTQGEVAGRMRGFLREY